MQLRGAPPAGASSRTVEEVALVATARRAALLRIHAFRLRREDLEDCFGQATLELLTAAAEGAAFASRAHIANTLELRFLSRVHDRRRALGGRSPLHAALEQAVPLGLSDEDCSVEIADRAAALEAHVLVREELREIERCAHLLSADQRLALASQLAGDGGAVLCSRLGWSREKYRKAAQRGRARLRLLVRLDGPERPDVGCASDQNSGATYEQTPPNS